MLLSCSEDLRFPLNPVGRSCSRVPVGPSPGHWRSRQLAFYSRPFLVPLRTRWTCHPFSVPKGLGPGLGLPFSSPRQRQARWGREGAPRSPRQVRVGRVDSFSCGEQVAPRSGPFCSLYFILKLYLMLLYERERGGERAVPVTLTCKCLIYYTCIRDKL